MNDAPCTPTWRCAGHLSISRGQPFAQVGASLRKRPLVAALGCLSVGALTMTWFYK